MAKQTFTTGQVLLASQLTSLQQTAMSGGAFSAKTSSYTAVAADAGTAISMTSTSATTITINNGLFAAGDTILITNLGSGSCVIQAGTATVNTAGSLSLTQYEAGLLHFVSASSAVFNDYVQAASNPLTTTGDMIYSSSGSTQARLGIGSTSQVLTVASGVPSWATPSSGSMTLLSTTSMNTGTATVTVSSISQSYKNLQIVILNPTWATTTSQLLFSAQSGSSIQGAGSTMWNSGSNVVATAFSGTSFSGSGAVISNTDGKYNAVWTIYDYATTTASKSWVISGGGTTVGQIGGGNISTNTAISEFSVSTTGGYNLSGGSILVYGIN